MLQSKTQLASLGNHTAVHFGALLKTLRHRHNIKQMQVLAHLPSWTQTTFSRLETGEMAPAFDQLAPIYTALRLAGVELTPQDRQQYLTLARTRIEAKKTYLEHKTDQEWDSLRVTLSQLDHTSATNEHISPHQDRLLSRPTLMETRHLLGRADWLASVITSLSGRFPKKLVVLQGPTGIGKSSELHRLALHFLDTDPRPHLIFCVLPNVEERPEPDNALDQFLGSLLIEVGPPDAAMAGSERKIRIAYVMSCLQKMPRPVVVLVDNAEHLLQTDGHLAPCWEQFLKTFLSTQHCASLVLATKEWPDWYKGEQVFVTERMIPSLTVEEGVGVLQRLGLASVPLEYLERMSEAVGGIPLCLEWTASLVQKPLWLDSWDELDDLIDQEEGETEVTLTRRVLRLLEDRALFGGDVASRLTPMLERIIDKRLSAEAVNVLHILSLAPIPLGKLPLQRLCPRPSLLKELRTVSLLTAHAQRVQVLPMVAAVVSSRLSPEQRQQIEEQLIVAYQHWLDDGSEMSDREMGAVIAELAVLYLKHHRLLDAAQHLIIYGWMSFNQGHALRIARLAQEVLQQVDWHRTEELECASLALMQILFPFLGISIDLKHYVDYQRIRDALLEGRVTLPIEIEGHVTQILMLDAMNERRFEEAQNLLEAHLTYLESRGMIHMKQHSSVLQKRAWLLGTWCEYAEEQGEMQKARELREQAIAIYRQGDLLLSSQEGRSPLNRNIRQRRLANWLNYLGYHLNRIGQYEEALRAVERAIALQEQGYVYVGGLAASYGEKSQILMGLGRFQEALLFDEKAVTEVQRWADAGDALSQEDVGIYQVNRGRLYLRLGRVDEAEQLLQEAIPHIHEQRSMYRMFAKEALKEIEQWHRQATLPQHQLDWRWVERYRNLASYDSYWWLNWSGPFTEEEQQRWDHLFTPPVGEAVRAQLGALLRKSCERELAAALVEQREPRLRYPAIEIAEVRRRITALLQLNTEIDQEEPNAIVRQLYHGAIEEEVDFLRLIEATYEANTERFWECSRRLFPVPTDEEMQEALDRVRLVLLRGLISPETAEISQRLDEFLRTRLHLTFDLSLGEDHIQQRLRPSSSVSSQPQRTVSAQATRRFFEAALRECDYDSWQVVIDSNATGARVEQGLRQMFLPEQRFSLGEIRHLLSHELLGHVARCAAGEHSLLGLLGIHTKNSSPTEEGLALYHERQVAALHAQPFDDADTWFGTLVTGLASGVTTPPQTFLSLYTFLELFSLLYRLLKRPDADRQKEQKYARANALSVCLRAYRGVPDLGQAGVCYLQDGVYLHGLRLIERAVAQDETVLDRLAVGVIALKLLPDLQELGITSAPQPLRKLAYDPDLNSYILSFEVSEEDEKQAKNDA